MTENSGHTVKTNFSTIVALNHNCEKTFRLVFEEYYKPLCSYSAQFIPFEEAENVVQDTLTWIWENRINLLPSYSLRSLLFTVVKNKSLDVIRHSKIKRKVLDQIKQQYDENRIFTPDLINYNELCEKFKEALSKLPTEYRETFYMSREKGMTYKQIANILNVSPQLVNYRISKALTTLRVELKQYLPLILFLYDINVFNINTLQL